MGTGFHESTVAMSVRNYLAIAGRPEKVGAIVARLRALWLRETDEPEVRVALKELVARKQVRRLPGGLYEAASSTVFHSRPHVDYRRKDREAKAWEWSTSTRGSVLDKNLLDLGRR